MQDITLVCRLMEQLYIHTLSTYLPSRGGGGSSSGSGARGGSTGSTGSSSGGSTKGSTSSTKPPPYSPGAPPPPYTVGGGTSARGSTSSTGGGRQYTVAAGQPFAGAVAGGGTRSQVYGSRGYGSVGYYPVSHATRQLVNILLTMSQCSMHYSNDPTIYEPTTDKPTIAECSTSPLFGGPWSVLSRMKYARHSLTRFLPILNNAVLPNVSILLRQLNLRTRQQLFSSGRGTAIVHPDTFVCRQRHRKQRHGRAVQQHLLHLFRRKQRARHGRHSPGNLFPCRSLRAQPYSNAIQRRPILPRRFLLAPSTRLQ